MGEWNGEKEGEREKEGRRRKEEGKGKAHCLKGVFLRGKRRVGATPWLMVYSAM